MIEPASDANRLLRQSIYGILIAIGIGGVVGRILAVDSVDRIGLEKSLKAQNRPDWQRMRPFLSGNDRSRWMTMRALVDHGTYSIDDIFEPPNWDTLDMVRHVGPDGKMHLYSSKPPLLATLLAGEYWLVKSITGWTLKEHPHEIGRFMLLTWHIPLLLIFYLTLAKTAERYGVTDWARIFVVAAGVFATFLTTFAIVLTNHLPAAVCAMVTLYCGLRVLIDGQRHWKYFALAGLCGGFMVVNELPSLSGFALLGAFFLYFAPRQTLLAFVPAALAVTAAFFGTNYAAHSSFTPPYDYRNHRGIELFVIKEAPAAAAPRWTADLQDKKLPEELRSEFSQREVILSEKLTITPWKGMWWVMDEDHEKVYGIEAEGNRWTFKLWDSWYHFVYPTTRDGVTTKRMSYWFSPGAKVDQGEESRLTYAFHVLVGHHGLFSLTPIWILTVIGLTQWRTPKWKYFALSVALVTLVCLAFYLSRPVEDRNYGGTTSTFRWALWFAPIWLTAMLPALDRAATARWSRIACLVLLAFSALSVAYPTWNPFVHPWILDFQTYLENTPK